MPSYAIRRGNLPAEVFVDGGRVTNLGPGTIYFADNQDVTSVSYEGTLAVSASVTLEGAQWFITDASRTSLYVVPGQATVGQGPKGDPGDPGAPGPAGQDAVAISDAVRGEVDRFYREIGGVLTFDGTGFVAKTDALSRPQNIDLVTNNSAAITITHEDILPRALVESHVTVGDNLDSVGIRAIAKTATDLKSTDIVLKQTRSLDDSISYNGSAWVKERGPVSPFTVTFASNVLHLVHGDVGSTKVSEIRITGTGLLRPVLVPGSVTTTAFSVAFYDDAGVQVTSASTNMAVSVSRNVRDKVVDPTALVVDAAIQKEQAWTALVASLSPKLWARLGESSGTSFNDEIGTNDGTSQATVTLGATTMIVGDANTGVTLDGAQGKIGFANPVLTGPFSISLLWKNTGASTVGGTQYATLIGWSPPGTQRRLMFDRTNGRMYAEMGGVVLTSPNASAAANTINHTVYTWDGTTQRIIHNGALIAEGVTANVTFNSAFWLGSYTATSGNYSFKGDQDELVVVARALTLTEAQQLYVTARDTAISVDRALQSRLGFRALFETFAPPPPPDTQQDPPLVTALPDGDIGGGATMYQSLRPYRSVLNDFYDWVGRPLPALQVDRNAILLNGLPGLAAATSTAWKNWFCLQWGIDPTTGATTGNGVSGSPTPLYLNIARHNIFVVPDDQPLRDITDQDTSVAGWASQFNAAVDARGGLPLPADAMSDSTGDLYTLLYQPGTSLIAILYSHTALSPPSTDERARTTIEIAGGAPSSGGFFLEFDYMDPVNRNVQTFFTQSPVFYNTTATQLQTLLFNSKTTSGSLLGTTRAARTPVLCSGGPLNVAPIETGWTIAGPLYPVGMRYTSNFMNTGTPFFTYHNSAPWSRTRLGAVTSPDVPNGHVPTIGGSKACATATRIVQLPLVIDWAEYKDAYDAAIAAGDGTVAGADWDAAGTDLGHVIGMAIGDCGTGSVYPATAGDGTLSNTDGSKMKEGALCTFPVDADASKVAPEMMPLFNTIKRYGFIPYDKTGGGSEFIFRNWIWPGPLRPFPGPATFNTASSARLAYMRQLPWHQMQIIDPADVLAGW